MVCSNVFLLYAYSQPSLPLLTPVSLHSLCLLGLRYYPCVQVRGRLRCLGSLQHLKERFSSGCVLELTFPSLAASMAATERVCALGGVFSDAQVCSEWGVVRSEQ